MSSMGQLSAVGIPKAAFPNSRILVVDDKQVNVELFTQVLNRGGYRNVAPLLDANYVSEAITGFEPDLIVLDLLMPVTDGFGVLKSLGRSRLEESPVLVVSSADSLETRHKALSLGASDFLPRPFDAGDALVRVGNLIRNRRALKRAKNVANQLAERLTVVQEQAEQAQIEMLARLARIIDHADDSLSQHTWRVARLAGEIAIEMGLPQADVDNIRRAARLHDLGKVVVSDSILTSTEPLSEDEISLIRAHPSIGALILSGGTSPLIRMAERIARSHHERWDGKGYPDGLSGEAIPVEARIVAVSDAFDAMTNNRAYRLALSEEEAVSEIRSGSGTQFDPDVVNAFFRVRGHEPIEPRE